ncbi:hypothetical protein D3C85_1245680 [compost metagenome]
MQVQRKTLTYISGRVLACNADAAVLFIPDIHTGIRREIDVISLNESGKNINRFCVILTDVAFNLVSRRQRIRKALGREHPRIRDISRHRDNVHRVVFNAY